MSFQAYLDTIEDQTGLTPRQLLAIAKSRRAQIDRKHVGTTGVHRDESDTLWLDGKASKPQ